MGKITAYSGVLPPEPWIQTASGRKVYPFDPKSDNIDIADIAHALSRLCRFTGHCRRFYSVAEHCLRVSYACAPEDALWGLLHDAAEAYIADVARPLKYTPIFAGYRDIETRLQRVIFETFGLSGAQPPSVKHADLRLVVTERRDLMPPGDPWSLVADPLPETIVPMSPSRAQRAYLRRFHELHPKESILNPLRPRTKWTEERKRQLADAYKRGGHVQACATFPDCTPGSIAVAASAFGITRRDQPIRSARRADNAPSTL